MMADAFPAAAGAVVAGAVGRVGRREQRLRTGHDRRRDGDERGEAGGCEEA